MSLYVVAFMCHMPTLFKLVGYVFTSVSYVNGG